MINYGSCKKIMMSFFSLLFSTTWVSFKVIESMHCNIFEVLQIDTFPIDHKNIFLMLLIFLSSLFATKLEVMWLI